MSTLAKAKRIAKVPWLMSSEASPIIDATLEDIYRQLNLLIAKVNEHEATIASLTATLTSHTATLADHEARLVAGGL